MCYCLLCVSVFEKDIKKTANFIVEIRGPRKTRNVNKKAHGNRERFAFLNIASKFPRFQIIKEKRKRFYVIMLKLCLFCHSIGFGLT